MENIKKYGDLTDEEYRELLFEIEDGDAQMESAQIENLNAISGDYENDAILEADYGEDAWRKYGKYFFNKPAFGQAENKIKKEERKKAQTITKREICAMAFSQTEISLSDKFTDEMASFLISKLTAKHTQMIERYGAYINKRLTAFLRPLIPQTLKRCMNLFPEAVRESPGFLYKAESVDSNFTFWAQPSIPLYFKQNTEQEILKRELGPQAFINIDKAVASYNEHFSTRQAQELQIARILIQKRISTYYDLLKLNSYWFNVLYIAITNEKR